MKQITLLVGAILHTALTVFGSECRSEKIYIVDGRDSRGGYSGFVQFTSDSKQFIRSVVYDTGTVVESDRGLAWLFQGSARTNFEGGQLTANLQRADFVTKRGGIMRTAADQSPERIVGDVKSQGRCRYSVNWQLGKEIWSETWDANADSDQIAKFSGFQKKVMPTHSPFTATELTAIFTAFQTFHSMPMVTPYVGRPEFKNGQHFVVRDLTDLDFYRRYPAMLRIRNKVVDAISLGEELARANAFRFSLAKKAQIADALNESRYFHPITKQMSFGVVNGERIPGGDGALWTGMYLASQFYRNQVEPSVQAQKNIQAAVEGLLWLQEITGDPKVFARTIRMHKNDNDPRWHRGKGAFSGFDWLERGNNDMSKGVMLGLVIGWNSFCVPNKNHPFCRRIQKNARDFADHVRHNIFSENQLLGPWIVAYVHQGQSIGKKYLWKAKAIWPAAKTALEKIGDMNSYRGHADWSGLHLNFASTLIVKLMSDSFPLENTTPEKNVVRRRTIAFAESTRHLRSGIWQVAEGAWVKGRAAEPTERLSRIFEIPVPKVQLAIDHRIRADFTVSPLPALPWKNDWTVTDRTQGTVGVPLYEQPLHDYVWKDSLYDYSGSSEGIDPALSDYSFIYWFGRKYNVIVPQD